MSKTEIFTLLWLYSWNSVLFSLFALCFYGNVRFISHSIIIDASYCVMAGQDHEYMQYSNNYDVIRKSLIIIITSLISGFFMIMMLIVLLTKLITKKIRCVVKHYKCVNLQRGRLVEETGDRITSLLRERE